MLFLASLSLGFFVIAEPAPTDLAFLLSMLLVLLSMKVHMPQAIHTYAILSFAFLLANTSSAAFCTEFNFCFRYMAITIYLFLIPLLMVHLVAANGPRYLPIMYKAYFVAIVVSALAGILARAGLMPGPTTLYFRADDGLRLSPFFKDPNVYAPYLGAGLIVMFGYVVAKSNRLWVGLLGLVIVWIPFLLAFSRAAWLSISVAAFLYLVVMLILGSGLFAGRRFVRIVMIFTFFAFPLTILVLYLTGLLGFFEHRLGLQSYDANRFFAANQAVSVALENPFGIGPGHFVGRTHFPGSQFDLAPHNVYAKVWVENGFFGLFVLLAIILRAMYDLLRIARLRTDRFPIHIALFACLGGILANGYFIDTLHWRHLFVILGFSFCEVYLTGLAHRRRFDTQAYSVGSRVGAASAIARPEISSKRFL